MSEAARAGMQGLEEPVTDWRWWWNCRLHKTKLTGGRIWRAWQGSKADGALALHKNSRQLGTGTRPPRVVHILGLDHSLEAVIPDSLRSLFGVPYLDEPPHLYAAHSTSVV
jgi:hypothetical protein